jgi:hypothetical protein
MTTPTVLKRLVFHVGGYDPNMPPEISYRRFVREFRRFQSTWSAQAFVAAPSISDDTATWDIITTGPNWRVETRYVLVRWDDVITSIAGQPLWRRIALGQLAFADFTAAGALWGYLRTNWRYALFFLYPFLMFDIFVVAAWLAGEFFARASEVTAIGAAAGLLTFAALMWGPWRWLHLAPLFDDWIFSRAYVRGSCPLLEQRLDRLAKEITVAARDPDVDELVVVGHSLGAVVAVDLLDCALKVNPRLGERGAKVVLLSIGSSILKIGLHRGAKRFHASLQRVAVATRIFWAEYQALIDVMNFYKTNPISELGLKTIGSPVIRIVKIRNMLSARAYRRIRRSFYRVHSQFVSGNERRTAYDYFMLICGPVSTIQQIHSPDGAASAIDENGALIEIPPERDVARESGWASRR